MVDHKLPFRIFAVDPATGKSGWAVLDVISLDPLRIKIIACGQLDGDKLVRQRKDMVQIFKKQYCILDALYEEYIRFLEYYNPDYIVNEGAFGYVHLNALISLTLAINTLRRAAHKALHKDTSDIAPMLSKKGFAGIGSADKDAMRQAYFSAPFLNRDSVSEDVSEHEIDAVAHGCAWVMIHITKELEIIPKKKKKR